MSTTKKNLRFRPIAILLMASMIALFAASAFGENITVGDFSYSYSLSTKEGTITKYNGSAENVTIPSTFSVPETYKDKEGETHTRYHTITVTAIGSSALQGNTSIKSIVFNDKLKSIGSSAFRGCTGLTSVRTPASLTSLGFSAFRDCTSLQEVEVNGTNLDLYWCTSIFSGCVNLRRAILGDGVVRLECTNGDPRIFQGCTSLQEVIVGNGVTDVPDNFLYGVGNANDKLSVSFCGRITRVGHSALNNANITNLSITVEDCEVCSSAFYRNPGVTLDVIDFSQIKSISSSAFNGCVNIIGCIDLSSVKSIGSSAFRGCTGLTSVRTSTSLTSLGFSAFSDCTSLQEVEVNGTNLDLYWRTSIFSGCVNLRRAILGDGVVRLECNNGDPRIFQRCTNLKDIVFRGVPPTTYNNSFNYIAKDAVGTYTAAHAAEWEAVIDSKGYWNGLKMKPSYYTVIYDANNGTGARTTATVEWGEPTPAGDGTFTWEAHYFMGWAFEDIGGSTLGSDDVIPEPQEGNTVTLYGQWATFEPVAADWGTGSITLKATGVSLKEGEEFFLSYCDASAAESDGAHWDYVEDLNKTTDGTGVSFTDTQFSSRLGGIPAVRYRLQIGKSKEDVRAKLYCTTRNRHAIFVGLNEWDGADLKPSGGDRDATNFFKIAAIRGGFTNTDNIHVLLNGGAKAYDVDDAFDSVAESVQTGDIFLFYFRTHGGYDKSDGTTFLCLYDKHYTDTALATKIQAVEANGKSVAIIGIVAACHAGGMYDPDVKQDHWYVTNGLGRCSANVAWIAAADREHTSYAVFSRFMLDYGWEEGWAGNNATLSFLDLATYTKNRYEALLGGIKSYEGWNVQIENPSLLRTIVAGTRGSHMNKNPASAVTGVKAETGDNVDEIKVEWNVVDNANEYWLFCERGGVDEFCSAYSCRADETEVKIEVKISFQKLFGDREINPSKLPIKCSVKAVNGAGVSVASAVEIKNFARIVFDANGGGISGWRGAIPYQGIVYADITVGSVLGGRLLTLPETYGGSNKEFTGWYSANGVQANPMEVIISDETYVAHWKAKNTGGMTQDWLDSHQIIASAANGDIATAAAMTAANGCRTVGECYALGIDPEDPNDDLKITDFRIEDGKPVITLNHTKDGSGNSFEPRIKTLGKANLTDADWVDVTDKDQSAYRFFKVTVDMP